MEEMNLDLTLDEAAEARIAHAEYLNKVKDWGTQMGIIMEPFAEVARILMNDNRTEEEMMIICRMFPIGLSFAIDHLNTFYSDMQKEAVKTLGAPFQLHEAHHPLCEENGDFCGHQDHYMPKENE